LFKVVGGVAGALAESEGRAGQRKLQPLQGRRIAILAADGFESVELTIPRTALRTAGALVDVVSIRSGKIRGMNLHLPAGKIRVDRTLEEADPEQYDALFIPGGFINPDLLRQSAAARFFVRSFELMDKPIASLCHGPWVLISAGLAYGRHVTSWPGLRDDLVNAGARWTDEPVVRDGKWVTSRGPQDLLAFIPAMIDTFAGAKAEFSGEGESSPARNAPPAWAIGPLAGITLPRVLLGAAAIGGAIALAARRAA
jgi:protease I